MSLVDLAARVILVEALSGKTFVGANVLAAPLEPLEDVTRLGLPVIAVYTSNPGGDVEGRDLLGGQRHLDVSIVGILPSSVTVGDVSVNTARGGAAMALDILGREVVAALQADLGPWATLWRRLVVRIEDYEVSSAPFSPDLGVRIPAKRIALSCITLPEPDFGSPIAGFWLALDTAMREDAALIPLADLIKAAIEGPEGMPDWQKVMAGMGWSLTALQASGLGPVDPTAYADGTEPAELADVAFDPAELHIAQPFGEAGTVENGPEPEPEP